MYVHLRAEYLQHFLGERYAKNILAILIAENIIEVNNQYQVGIHSKGFRLNEIYRNNATSTYYIKDKILMKKIEAKEQQDFESLSDLSRQILDMMKTRFQFDYSNAFKLITQQNHSRILDVSSTSKAFNQLKELERGNIYLQESKLTGRIFHTYSNLKRDLRNFIYHVSGEQLIEIDISNSQPFFLGLIASQIEQTEDTKRFLDIVTNGKFYSYLRTALEIPDDVDDKDFKQDVLTMLYCPSYWNIKHKQKFDELFPTINQLIQVLKADDYKRLAQELQKMESDIMINTIAPRLLKEMIDFIPIT